MKIGKIPETVLKRSVLKQIRTKRKEVLVGAGVGEDCAVLSLKEDEVFVISTDPITAAADNAGRLAIIASTNDIASSGAEPVGAMVSALLPEDMEEPQLCKIMQQMEETCASLNIQLMGGHTEVTRAVNWPVLTVTAVGKAKRSRVIATGGAKPGQDIVVTKWIALEGASILACEREAQLLEKYPPGFVEEVKGYGRFLSVAPEAAIAARCGASAMHDVTEGGIFGALWELAESAGVGLSVELKKIPVRQEAIELCEFFGLNPYGFISGGALLIAIDRGHDLVDALAKEGIDASVIGKVTEGNDRVVINGDEKRFLEPPRPDELYKVTADIRCIAPVL